MKTVEKQHLHQKNFFNRDFSKIKKYKLYPWQKSYLDRIRQSLLDDKKPSQKVFLDVGCGSGYVSIEMAKLGYKVVALDISQVAINDLKKNLKKEKKLRIKTLLSPVEKIKLPNSSIDYISANAILEHVVEEEKTVKEIKRVLKRGGRIYITVPQKYKYQWPFFVLIHYVYDKRIGHLRRYDLEYLKQIFGLKTVKVYYSGHFWKMIWALFSALTGIKSEKVDNLLEKYDASLSHRPFGATNISVVFEK